MTNCRSNYDPGDKVTVFRLPKETTERERWKQAIPRDNIPDSTDTVVCEKHFPPGYEKIQSRGGRFRPKHPPSVFDNLPSSVVPTPPPKKRKTTKCTFDTRTVMPDEIDEFTRKDLASFDDMCLSAGSHKFIADVITYKHGDSLCIQSADFLPSVGIPLFMIKINPDLSFICFHVGCKTSVQTLAKNKVYRLTRWSQIEETVRYLSTLEIDQKKKVLHEQCVNLNVVTPGQMKYTSDVIMRAFEYYACSRSLYERLREDLELPSISLLTRLSSKVNNSSDRDFINNFFSKLHGRNKNYVLLIDEVYVKSLLTYHGGALFGKAVNNPEALATTVLGFMLVPCFKGPSCLVKMLPVNKLEASFLFVEARSLIAHIKDAGGVVTSIVCDNNKVNQCFFGMFQHEESSPWRTADNIFLLYDYVHLLKSVRNNWLTEKMGEIEYTCSPIEDKQVAKWDHLKKLQKMEEGDLVKQSRLTFTAVNPKPIERQHVNTCLRVFCDETIQALTDHPGMKDENAQGTVTFLQMFVKFWKIMNVKSQFEDVNLRDPRRAAFSSATDPRLDFLAELAALAKSLRGGRGTRVKMLTCDTSKALEHTCRGVIDLIKLLLETTHDYVLLGKFTSDPIEKAFGKLRQGSGGTYFINAQQILEKVNISKTKVLLRLNVDLDDLNAFTGHMCEKCGYKLTQDECSTFDSLPDLESKLKDEIKGALVYIAGYVFRHDDEDPEEDSHVYFETYGDYTAGLDRGGLHIPNDSQCQWTIYSYMIFQLVVNSVCRNSLSQLFEHISVRYSFHASLKHACILSNILFNNFCASVNVRSDKETKLKVLKLS